MPRRIVTHFLPELFEPEALRRSVAVVIDVLRASTTICHALDAGATMLLPCEAVEDARRMAAQMRDRQPLLGGERGGELIEGFDLDNSPLRYTPEVVAGRPVVFTTTNGTRALVRCRDAERILIGAFVNRGAVVREILLGDHAAHLVCAGTNGRITSEDVLFAGAVAVEIAKHDPDAEWSEETRIAAEFFRSVSHEIHNSLRASLGGRNLRSLGLEADIARAAEIDRFDFVPQYSPRTGLIERRS